MIEYLYQVRGTERVVKMGNYVNDPYAKYNDVETRRMQVVFLRRVLKESYDVIVAVTGYAKSTAQSYQNKFSDLVEKAKAFFGNVVKEVKQVVKEVKAKAKRTKKEYDHGFAYVIDFFYDNGKKAFLKIGKTCLESVEKRANQYVTHYNKKHDDAPISAYKVRYFFKTNNEDDALTMENALRKHYKEQENSGYLPQDRFLNGWFDLDELLNDEKVTAQYSLLGYSVA